MNLPRIRNSKRDEHRGGTAMIFATVVAVAMAVLCLALLDVNMGTGRARVQTQNLQRAFYAAEAGLSDAFVQVSSGALEVPSDAPGQIGTPEEPMQLGTSSYWAQVTRLDSRSYSVAATGTDGRSQQRLELILSEAASGFFQYAAFGDKGVVLDSNAFIDSYDSALGSYESQVQGGNDYARENGDVGSNSNILLRSNTVVHGDAIPGPGHVVQESTNVYVSGSKEPAEEPVEMPPIEVPTIASSGRITSSSDVVLGPGEVHYDSIQMGTGTTLRIRGPATLVVDDFLLKSNTNLVFDSAGGPIELYGTGNFVLESSCKVSTFTDSALGVTLLLSGNNMTKRPADRVQLSSNADFIGAIYAPDVNFRLSSNFNIYGSIMCGYLDLSSFGQLHFDEALLYDGWGSTDELEPLLWQRLALE